MRTPEGGGTFQQSRPFTSFNSRKQSSSFKSQNKLLKRKLVHKQWGEINTSIPLIWLVFCFFFVSAVLFHGAPLSHQEGSLGVIQGIKLIIGLIRRICILMRHSVTRPLRLKCYPTARWPDWETRPPLWIVSLQRLIIQSQWCNTFPKQQAQPLGKEIGFVLQKNAVHFIDSFG